MYLYLASNRNDYLGAFSTKDFAETYGCDVKSAKTAFHTLEEKGYIRQDPEKKNRYIFSVNKIKVLPSSGVERKQFFDKDTNTNVMLTYEEVLQACDNDEAQAKELWGE